MQISQNPSPSATPASATSGKAAADQAAAQPAALSPDFETFLKMLTTQLKNQDPLNPMDSADYAVQLATFSGVEQQMKTNQLLDGLSSQMGAMGMAQLAGWVGMEAQTTEPVWFGGSPLTLSVAPKAGSDRAVLVARDATGAEVARTEAGGTSGEIAWAGTKANGAPLPSGAYSFALESYRDDSLVATEPVAAYGRILEARAGDGGPVLVMQGGGEVAATAISALRAPG
ncbi:hypothetical protein U879_16095 [Defluviimonas sp. 20V17]|uniref:Basal-body rod modification protein FlgD n=1 Tax=Allgaiera indica TaxID=765699 RepID=A0AAN4URH6_9RHOB|nr:flagellar hook capping FlgD N-terminal domain-containing protein [Allgaiera indica]KDB02714.1 hypothetical protein U879_16095 [Defluviimonas sp. 20V17]GHE01741.1 basal-body rod modification protein FlgD [Allgaiera indica]SDW93911.1 flagellar basal-body rod modification protein FlgD [Allgaiera indica]